MDNILPQPYVPCPCNKCEKRHFDKEKNRTCHCDCQEYKEWSDGNRQWHDKCRKASMLNKSLDSYEVDRIRKTKRRMGIS